MTHHVCYSKQSTPPSPSHVARLSILQSCASFGHFLQIHAQIVRHHLAGDPFIVSKLIEFCSSSPLGNLPYARKLFNVIRHPNVFSWNTLIRGHACSPNPIAALNLLRNMLATGIVPNFHTYPFVLKACTRLSALKQGEQIHGFILKSGTDSDVFSLNGLIRMYCACGLLEPARNLFDRMPERGIVSWNAMINGYVKFGYVESARKLFNGMPERNVETWNTLIAGYAKCGQLNMAWKLFEEMPVKNVVTWSTMISAYAQGEQPTNALNLFEEMKTAGAWPNYAATVSLLSSCSQLGALHMGRKIHLYIERNKMEIDSVITDAMINGYVKFGYVESARKLFNGMPERNVETWNTLIAGYAKCGQLNMARKIFEEMPVKNVVTWSTMISAYAQGEQPTNALNLFEEMKTAGAWPNYAATVSLLSSCSQLGALHMGRKIHLYIERNKMEIDSVMRTALIDMYSKCGCIDKAFKIFSALPHNDVFSWSAIIGGLAVNGQVWKALDLFNMMEEDGVRPNRVTFVGVLCACSHGGLVDLAKQYFYSMRSIYGIEPQIEHYGCMLDALGRAGLLQEAEALVQSIPGAIYPDLWVTLLGASWIHGDLKIAEMTVERLSGLKPNDGGIYVILSNIYAVKGMWNRAREVRILMKSKGLKKEPSRSMIEVCGKIHEFFVGDQSHPETPKIFEKLNEICVRIRIEGYEENTRAVLFDIENEEKENVVTHHCEKLAIAFALIYVCGEDTIRVVKNIRVCEDCHTFAKHVSKVYEREIILRDRNVFHYFRGGSCSCGDYW
ncbi:Pentatricopeptide repeat-containing protein [Platanthera guangdongensis]|uniref:Pentatricopeptide repeat-containing protein n=1 Tax=Platanthera guangdongensis TaxID=2320717 RepID=A0ABR2MHK3_9ASPA